MTQRVEHVRRRRTRRRARTGRVVRTVTLALVVVALALGGRWLVTSPRLAVGPVEVRGTSRIPVEQVLEAAAIVPGTNILRLDPVKIAERVEMIPAVRRAEVIRELPNHVTILIEERRPFTLVHGARLHWLDDEGRLLGQEPQAVAPTVPIVSGLSEEEVATMRTAPTPKARIALALIRALLRSGSALTDEISEIDMSRKDGPVLYTVTGVEIRLGTEDWEDRLGRLEGVLNQVAAQDSAVTVVDLRFRDQVVLKRGG